MKFLLLAGALCTSSAMAQPTTVCVEIDKAVECFSDLDEAVNYVEFELSNLEMLERIPRGKTDTDRPNMRELMKAAVEALGSRGFNGEITVEVRTPSGYIFKVIVKGGSRGGRRPKPISKPNQ